MLAVWPRVIELRSPGRDRTASGSDRPALWHGLLQRLKGPVATARGSVTSAGIDWQLRTPERFKISDCVC